MSDPAVSPIPQDRDLDAGLRALALLQAEDHRNDKIHELLETIREQIRVDMAPEHRPEGLMTNIQNAVYAMRGRTRLMNDAAITAPLSSLKARENEAVAVGFLNAQGGFLLTDSGAEWFKREIAASKRDDIPGIPTVALYAAPPTTDRMGTAGVRKLEWDAVTDQIPKHAFAAYTPFSRWLIVCEFLSMNHMVYRFNGTDYETLDQAKAAAQADFTSRIMSALEPVASAPTAPEPAAAVSEAQVEAACRAHAPQWDGIDPEIQVYARQQMRAALRAASLPSWREMVQNHSAAMRMVRDAIEELFGPIASLESEEATLLRGPQPHHEAEAIIEALQRVRNALP